MPRTVFMDFREERSGVGRILESAFGFEVISLPLWAGDYLLKGRFRAERKTLTDFVLSLCDGRLFAQAAKLSMQPECPMLILEGRGSVFWNERVHPSAVAGAMAQLAARFDIRTILSPGPEGTAQLIESLFRSAHQPRAPVARIRPGRRPGRWQRRAVFLLCGFPGVGPVRAATLLARFGSIEGILRASIADLAAVSGVGRLTAKAIRELLAWRWGSDTDPLQR